MPPLIHVACCWLLAIFLGATTSFDACSTALLAVVATCVGACFGVIATHRVTGPSRDIVTIGTVCAIAAVGCSGALTARAARADLARCASLVYESLARGDRVRAVFDDRIASGQHASSAVRGVLAPMESGQPSSNTERAHCRVPAVARVAGANVAPGIWCVVSGTPVRTDRGVRLTGIAIAADVTRSDWRRVARGRSGERIDRDFGKNAALVRALLIADQDGIAPDVRDRFADAGLVHMLSISGLHVAIIASALLTVASALRLSRVLAFGASLVVICIYVVALGAPPPAVRSAVMLAIVGISEHAQRPVHPWTALALGAVIPTFDPLVVLDLGWQLSVAGMAALVAARAMMRRLRHDTPSAASRARSWKRVRRASRWARRRIRTLSGWRYDLFRELVTGVVATLVTAPIIAWTFGRISLIAPLSNVLASPVVAVIQPALFLALLLSPWPAVSQWIAGACAIPLTLLDSIAAGAAHVPYASAHVAPTAIAAIAAGIASAAFVRATASSRWTPALVIAACALTIAVWSPSFSFGSGRMELHMLDVGQGDALAVRTPRGRWILIDAGRRWDGGDAGRRVVIPYVQRFGGAVAAFVMTHAHDDHVGGAASVVQALTPLRVLEPAWITPSGAYERALVATRDAHVQWHRVQPGDHWRIDDVDVQVLAPDSAWTAAQVNANETSVMLRVQYGHVVMLLTGDAEVEEEQWVLNNADRQLLHADVLKLGHHGSKTSSSLPFLDAIEPRIGLISVGEGNRYGHPSPETLTHFAERRIPTLRTDHDGTIVVSTDGTSLEVQTRDGHWSVPNR